MTENKISEGTKLVEESQKLLFKIIEEIALYHENPYRFFDVDIKLIKHEEVF